MKRLILSTVCMLFCATGLWAQTLVDGIYYRFDTSSKTASVIEGSNSYSGSITIPSTVTYNGTSYIVTSIGDLAFKDCSGLTSVTIPNGVTNIGSGAFRSCIGLTSITIPNSVTTIESSAFHNCTGLTSITIPNSVTSIGGSAFRYCTGLTSITIPNSVTSIGNSAFSFCSGLTSVTIPNSVTSIGNSAFASCSGLTSITIPNSVTSIGDEAFRECGLTSITIPNSVTSIGRSAFNGCTSLTGEVVIPEGVTSIGSSAFENCSGLTSVTIPNSVTSIGNEAFSGCKALTNIEIPNSVTSIGNEAFSGCKALTSITIPNGVTSIGYYAFYGCSGLTSITIPNSVTEIWEWAFYGCKALISIEIPNSVTSIGESAFRGCSGLASITIPNSVTSIGSSAFYNCTGLTSIIVPCGKYGYFTGIFTEYTSIIHCASEVVTNVNNENYGTVTGEGVYEYGTSITLTATPNDHYHFVKWNDGNTDNPRTLQVTQDSTFTAVFAIDEHNVTISKNLSAAGTVTGDGVYEYGTNITLTATANEGYRFKGWSDGVMDASREITVTKDTIITANFVALYTIKALASASQGTVSGGGIYEDGETVTLVANAKAGYTFAQWVDGNDENPRIVTVNGNKTYTAIFAIDEHNVTLSKNISAAGTVTGDGVYEHNTTVQLTATANEGYRFKGWSDGVTDASREITVTKDIDLIANFVPLYTLKTLASASQGTVIGGGVYEDGETVTLVANPNPGYIFAQWVDGSDENPRNVTVDGDKTYTAYFIEGESDAATATPEAEESIVETARYDINGRPLNAPVKGVNIVKYSDGSFEKEFVQ